MNDLSRKLLIDFNYQLYTHLSMVYFCHLYGRYTIDKLRPKI